MIETPVAEPARVPSLTVPLRPVGRLGTPVMFVLTGLCLLLPFLAISCSGDYQGHRYAGTAGFTGADLVVGGRFDVHATFADEQGVTTHIDITDIADDPFYGSNVPPVTPQPLVAVGLGLLGLGVLVSLVPHLGWRRMLSTTMAVASGVCLFVGVHRAQQPMVGMFSKMFNEVLGRPADEVRQHISYGPGFWLAVTLLGLIVVVNLVGVFLVAEPSRPRAGPISRHPGPSHP